VLAFSILKENTKLYCQQERDELANTRQRRATIMARASRRGAARLTFAVCQPCPWRRYPLISRPALERKLDFGQFR
jgi:hypothetical protein